MRLTYPQLLHRIFMQLAVAATTVIQQILLVPVFLSHWSDDLYRSWLIILSISTMLIVVDLGLHSLTYLKLHDALRDEKDPEGEVSATLANSARAYATTLSIAGAFIVFGCLLLPIPSMLNLSGASSVEMTFALIFMMFSGLTTVASSYLSAILRAQNAINPLASWSLIQIIATTAAICLALILDGGIAEVAAAYFAIQLVLLAGGTWLTRKHMSQFRGIIWLQSTIEPIEVLKAARAYIIPVSADLVLLSVPTIVMGFLGISATGVVLLSLTRVIASFVRQVATFITNAFVTEVGHLWAAGYHASARRSVLLCMAAVGTATGMVIAYFLIFQEEMVRFWTMGGYRADPVVTGLMLGNVALAFPSITAFGSLMLTGRPRSISYSKVVQFIALVILCVTAGGIFGARGIAAAIFVSEAVCVSIPLALELKRAFAVQVGEYVLVIIVPFVSGLLISLASAELAVGLLPPGSLLEFFLASLLWLPLPAGSAVAGLFFLMRTRLGERS
ncbi:hypothetical protein HFO68_32980 [Rhizobium laguerreae]|uniref:hypothetical protein n=1 Tax=Rhizobium laguerreae TaxID=1076926 RepID=UPI001C92B2AE|nr:hypothetical protein [Rhizobium laguerreae]MBY3109306.1 hypothetical protein [Rhizobium laguerreae]